MMTWCAATSVQNMEKNVRDRRNQAQSVRIEKETDKNIVTGVSVMGAVATAFYVTDSDKSVTLDPTAVMQIETDRILYAFREFMVPAR